MELLASSRGEGITAILVLCAVISLAATVTAMRSGNWWRGLASSLALAALFFAAFFVYAGGDRSARKSRGMPKSKGPAESPTSPFNVTAGNHLRHTPPFPPEALGATEPETGSQDPPDADWEQFGIQSLEFAEDLTAAATSSAMRIKARAEALKERIEHGKVGRLEPGSSTTLASEAKECPDLDLAPPRPAPNRGPLKLIGVLGGVAILYVGYMFLDANTRGQFTWPLRVVSLLALSGIIVAVVTLA